MRRIGDRLKSRSHPHLQMALIVTLSGFGGLLASFVLMVLGLEALWLRYALAVLVAYAVFLLSVWIWIKSVRRTLSSDAVHTDVLDTAEIPDVPVGQPHFVGGGGHSGGGGASASFGSGEPAASPAPDIGGGHSLFDVDLDEGIVVLAVLAAIASAAIAAIYLVVIAPTFFAEVIVDGALSLGLYRRLRRTVGQDWLQSAMKRTVVPFFVVAMFFVIAGIAMQVYAPEARSIGAVWEHYLTKHH